MGEAPKQEQYLDMREYRNKTSIWICQSAGKMEKLGQREKLARTQQPLHPIERLPAPASVIVIRFDFALEFEVS